MNTADKKKLVKLLGKAYPDAKSELNFNNPYQLLVAVLLSAQCTDKKVNEVTPRLFAKYSDFKNLAGAKLSELERIIRPINYYKTKAKNLKQTAQIVTAVHRGEVPLTLEELTLLPGVGRKTALVILGETGAAETLPVDTHVMRVSFRLGLTTGKNPVQVEEDLKGEFPPKLWRRLHHWLILHGRRVCKARIPDCARCVVNSICPSSLVSTPRATLLPTNETLKKKRRI